MASRKFTFPDGRQEDLDYFVKWRPYLWGPPVARAIAFLGDLRGKRVLEIGGRFGRMTSLFAMLGAEVTMLQMGEVETARKETRKWNVENSTRLLETDGSLNAIANETFDVVFTKSVLWSIKELDEFLDGLASHLAPGGKVAFLENYRGGPVLFWLRKKFRPRFSWKNRYHGITPAQHSIFRKHFADVHISRHRWLVYEIFGSKDSGGGSFGKRKVHFP